MRDTHGRDKDQELAGTLAFWEAVGDFLSSTAICANPAVTVTVIGTNRPRRTEK